MIGTYLLTAGHLTKQLLAFSRQAVLSPEVLNLNEVLRTTSAMLRRIIGEDIELEVIEEPDLFNSRVDAAQVQEILLNLATNARDAMPYGGKLIFRTENYVAGTKTRDGEPWSGEHALLVVSDTGEGMDEATVARVFEPFFTTKPVGKCPVSELVALLGSGDSWSTSALSMALGKSQRSVQRDLGTLEQLGKVSAIGRGRAQRWVATPSTGFATTLLLVARGALG